MTQTRARTEQKKPQTKTPPKAGNMKPRAASIKTTKSPMKQSNEPKIDEARFSDLWIRFEDEAGFTNERLAQDRQKLIEELAALQAKLDEKKATLDAVEGRLDSAKQQMRMLLGARLSDDAILSAMRVEYKVRKVATSKKAKEPLPPAADEDKQFVIDNLDAEGLSVVELKQLTGRDARFLRATLEALVQEGKIAKTGDRSKAKYHLA